MLVFTTPLFGVMTTGSSLAIKAFIALIDFMGRYGKAFIPVITVLTAYTVKAKIATLYTKLLGSEFVATNTKLVGLKGGALVAKSGLIKVVNGFKALGVAIKANPIGFFISLLTAGIAAFIAFSKEVETAAETIDRINESSNKTVTNETRSIQLLLIELEDELTTKERKAEIIEQLRIAMDMSTKSIDKEALSIANARKEFNKYSKEKELHLRNEAIEKEITSLSDQKDNYKVDDFSRISALGESMFSDKKSLDIIKQIDVNAKAAFDDKIIALQAEKTLNNIALEKIKVENIDDSGTVGGEVKRINKEIEALNKQRLTIKADDNGGLEAIDAKIQKLKKELQGLNNPVVTENTPILGTIGGEVTRISKEIEALNKQRLTLKVTDDDGIKAIDAKIQSLKKELQELDNSAVKVEKPVEIVDYTPKQKDFLFPKSAMEHEKISYQERLKEFGLFNKQVEDMTKLESNVLKSLNQEHQDNITRIANDEASSKVNSLVSSLDDRIAIMKNQHLRELAVQTLTDDERKALSEKHQEEMAKVLISGYTDIATELRTAIHSETLGEMILTPEQTNVILKLLQQIEDKRNKVLENPPANSKDGGFYGPLNEKSKSTSIPIIGGTAGEWDEMFKSFDDWDTVTMEDKAQAVAAAVGMSFQAIGGAFSAMNQLMTASENKELDNFQRNQESKEHILKRQLDAGGISQDAYNAKMVAMQEEMDKKREEADIKQAKRNKVQAIIDALAATSVAVASALPNIPLSIVVGALGLAQVGMIAAIPIASGYEEGGYTMRDDGKVFKTKESGRKSGYVGGSGAELIVSENGSKFITGENGGEFVISNKALNNPAVASMAQEIDNFQRGGYLNAPRVPVRGYEDGGYSSKQPKRTRAKKNESNSDEFNQKLFATLERIDKRFQYPIESVISSKELKKSIDKNNNAVTRL